MDAFGREVDLRPDRYAAFGEELRLALLNAGRTQAWLASELFTDPGAVSRWVNGRGLPHMDSVRRIEEVLGVELMPVLAEALSANRATLNRAQQMLNEGPDA